MSRLIAFCAPARAGKDTAAGFLVTHLRYVQVAFAEPLKRMAEAGLELIDDQLHGHAKDKPIDWLDGVTPRRILQTLGTEWGRELIHTELWVRVARRRIERLLAAGIPVAVSDLRFGNEAQMVRELGGTIVRIERDGLPPVEAHASERQPIAPDWMIENNGSLGELRTKVLNIALFLETGGHAA